MKPWKEDLLACLSAVPTEQALFKKLQAVAHKIGFDHCAYGLRLPFPLTQPKTVMYNTYPNDWQTRYMAENFLAIDPTVRHGASSLRPLVWDDPVFREAPEFWEEAHSHGIEYGWSQASIDVQGIRGMLTLARSDESLSEAELRTNGHQIAWLTQVAHQCMSRLVEKRILPDAAVKLSSREKEVLQWTAEGKTAGETSEIMNITERTVNFHIANAMEKLSCANKTAATVRAALLGLLY